MVKKTGSPTEAKEDLRTTASSGEECNIKDRSNLTRAVITKFPSTVNLRMGYPRTKRRKQNNQLS